MVESTCCFKVRPNLKPSKVGAKRPKETTSTDQQQSTYVAPSSGDIKQSALNDLNPSSLPSKQTVEGEDIQVVQENSPAQKPVCKLDVDGGKFNLFF